MWPSGSAYTGIYDRPDLGRRDLRRLSTVLAGARATELVLVDCPPSLNGLTRMAWSASDKVALVAEPGLFSVAGTERTMRAIQLFRQEFAPKLSPAGIVANRVRTGSAEHTFRLSEMESMFGDLLLTPHIPEQANWQQIQGAAHSIHHWPGDSAKNAAALFDALLQNLLTRPAWPPAGAVRDRSATLTTRHDSQANARGRRPGAGGGLVCDRRACSSLSELACSLADLAGRPALAQFVVGKGLVAACSLGRAARLPSTSRQTRPTAMPKTPWPPWTRSMTSSAEVHS